MDQVGVDNQLPPWGTKQASRNGIEEHRDFAEKFG
jgi:hypothetical protein